MPLNPISFKARLSDFHAEFEPHLERSIPQQTKLSDVMRYALLGGGKRIRPFLMVNTARIFESATDGVWTSAAALECVHVYSLIHDDLPCMDDDDLRRGKPTVHKAYDEAMAVLAGDGLLTRAFGLLSQIEIDPGKQVKLISRLAEAAGESGMIGGQVLDIKAADSLQNENSISELQKLKTGALIRYAVWCGAFLAGAQKDEIKNLELFADDLGLLFQITDDILDVTGDAETVGKAVNKDENLGKATFVSILGLAGAKERATILADRAKRRLEPFGEKAQILSETVDYIRGREH